MIITPEQSKAARTLLKWRVEDLMSHSKTTADQIRNFEQGRSKSGEVIEAIYKAFLLNGIRLTPTGGVDIELDLERNKLNILEGKNCYLELLSKVHISLKKHQDKTLYILFSSDKISPPAVNDAYIAMRNDGIIMRQLISSEDNYILGELDEYRTIPAQYFTNIVTLIYADYIAHVNSDETRITIQNDPALATLNKKIFTYLWSIGNKPTHSVAKHRFE